MVKLRMTIPMLRKPAKIKTKGLIRLTISHLTHVVQLLFVWPLMFEVFVAYDSYHAHNEMIVYFFLFLTIQLDWRYNSELRWVMIWSGFLSFFDSFSLAIGIFYFNHILCHLTLRIKLYRSNAKGQSLWGTKGQMNRSEGWGVKRKMVKLGMTIPMLQKPGKIKTKTNGLIRLTIFRLTHAIQLPPVWPLMSEDLVVYDSYDAENKIIL